MRRVAAAIALLVLVALPAQAERAGDGAAPGSGGRHVGRSMGRALGTAGHASSGSQTAGSYGAPRSWGQTAARVSTVRTARATPVAGRAATYRSLSVGSHTASPASGH